MTGRKRLIAIGVAVFFFGAMISFPARVAYTWFVPESVKLSGISGTIWNGSAAQGIAGGLYFGDLEWSFKPLSLITGKLAFDTRMDVAGGSTSLAVGVGLSGAVSIKDLSGSFAMAAAHPAFRQGGIDGMLNVQFESLVLKHGWPIEAEGTVGIGNLIATKIGNQILGNFRAEFSTDDTGVVGAVSDAGAILDVIGTLRLDNNRGYSLVGTVSANKDTPAMINQNLRTLGSPDANGQRPFRVEGSL